MISTHVICGQIKQYRNEKPQVFSNQVSTCIDLYSVSICSVYLIEYISCYNCIFLLLTSFTLYIHRYTVMSDQYRQIVPGSSPISDDQENEELEHSPPPEKGTWKKRVSTACLACKKSKRKVSHSSPSTSKHSNPQPVQRDITLRKLPNFQTSLHLRRIPRPASPCRSQADRRRALLPPRPPSRSLQAHS